MSFNDPIPKKSCQDAKHYILCKRHGGMYPTQNMSDCHKYKKDSTCMKGFGMGQCSTTTADKEQLQS
jgi:hypothetical protein